MLFTKEDIRESADLEFESRDLERNVTVCEWLKETLLQLIRKGEGFSGKRPFGNSGWEHGAYAAFIEAGVVSGELDHDGLVERIDREAADELLMEIVKAMTVGDD